MPGPPNRTTPSFQPNTSTSTPQMNGFSTSISKLKFLFFTKSLKFIVIIYKSYSCRDFRFINLSTYDFFYCWFFISFLGINSCPAGGNAMTNGQVVTSGIKMEVPSDVTIGTEPSGATDVSGCCCRFRRHQFQ